MITPQRVTSKRGSLMRVLTVCITLVTGCLLQAQTYTVLHALDGANEGSLPNGLYRDSAGNLYGTTNQNGSGGKGTVFKLSEDGTFTTLHAFSDRPDGAYPAAGLVGDRDGNLYGTTENGGEHGGGTIFKIDSSGTVSILHSFNTDGLGVKLGFPTANLIWDHAGHLYGTASSGSGGISGGVFITNPAGNGRIIATLDNEERSPDTALARDAAGNLYGTTGDGGPSVFGLVYKVSPDGVVTVLHYFDNLDGAYPASELIFDAVGNLYGTTRQGGQAFPFGMGVVFKMDLSGNETVLYNIGSSNGDGDQPYGGLVMDTGGNLYGTTRFGGDIHLNGGTVFKIDPSGKETILHTFTGADGSEPCSTLLISPDGTIFGTTTEGGFHNAGVIFRLKP